MDSFTFDEYQLLASEFNKKCPYHIVCFDTDFSDEAIGDISKRIEDVKAIDAKCKKILNSRIRKMKANNAYRGVLKKLELPPLKWTPLVYI